MTTSEPPLDRAAVKQAVLTLLSAAHGRGVTPDRLLWHIDVTHDNDPEIARLAQGLAIAGLTSVVLVDDRQPPRPATVPTPELNLNHVAALASARAGVLLGNRESPFLTIDDPLDRFTPTTLAAAVEHGTITDTAFTETGNHQDPSVQHTR